jgi:LDH2 family malate/lactate/ureidoglycolate dehydrogenase
LDDQWPSIGSEPEGAEYPGLRENEEQRQRRLRGIPLQRKVAELIDNIFGDLSVSPMGKL